MPIHSKRTPTFATAKNKQRQSARCRRKTNGIASYSLSIKLSSMQMMAGETNDDGDCRTKIH